MLRQAANRETTTVTPLDTQQRQRVGMLTEDYVQRANAFFNTRFETPEVLFDLKGRAAGIPQRRQKRFPYRCACSEYAFTARRHNRVVQGRGLYLCRKCGTIICHQPEPA